MLSGAVRCGQFEGDLLGFSYHVEGDGLVLPSECYLPASEGHLFSKGYLPADGYWDLSASEGDLVPCVVLDGERLLRYDLLLDPRMLFLVLEHVVALQVSDGFTNGVEGFLTSCVG